MKFIKLLLAVVAAAFVASAANAAPDQSGSGDIAEPNGFPGVCDAPCYTVTKSYEYYSASNATAPGVCAAGENTYVYQLTHTGGTGTPLGFIPAVTQFELSVETDDVGSATELPGFGISPSGVVVNAALDVVTFDFGAPPIASGQTSTKLVICSQLLPGSLADSIVSLSAQASLDASGQCIGPVLPPAGGDPMPCTIGYWKNRTAGKKGTLQHFPAGEFEQIVTQAVALSGGLFTSDAELLAALTSKGARSAQDRALQQFSAFLLNLAAGDLFPENSKCRLFETNTVDSNACGSGISIQTAVDNFFAAYNSGDYLGAKNCADDTNNGIGVVGATEGD
jgi:hypothetical protein